MNNKERINAILHYQKYDMMPVVSFGFWNETCQKWAEEGHITQEESQGYCSYGDNSEGDRAIMKKLGFDFNWNSCVSGNTGLSPWFEPRDISVEPDGSIIQCDGSGLIVRTVPGVVSIPAEIGTSLTGRKAWEELYLPKLQYTPDRIDFNGLKNLPTEIPVGLYCGSLFGLMRNLLGVEHLSYLYADDEELYDEIIETFGTLSYQIVKAVLETGNKFDYAHFWEDICFKNGPLVSPSVFKDKVGPQYKKITGLLKQYSVDIVSVDCDGMIDALIPTWLENGVNTMFPIEVGTWDASIAPWREKYGRELRGVGGMNKTVFAQDYKAVDKEIERLKALVALGGYIPCPDHRIAPDAIFENVQYYCEQFKKTFI